MTARNGSTIRMSERNTFSAFNNAVISAITRKMLNSSLAAVKLALKMLATAETGLCVHANVTRNVAITDGTTTFARQIMVRTIMATPSRYTQCVMPIATCSCMFFAPWETYLVYCIRTLQQVFGTISVRPTAFSRLYWILQAHYRQWLDTH